MISIIIPVYNASEYLEECLDSIIRQTYNNLEIICVDDGSTDDSVKIIHNYIKKNHRIKLFKQENKGPGVARNTGLEEAKGNYIVFIDADDMIPEDSIENLYNSIENSQCDIVVASYKSFFDNYEGELVEPYLEKSKFHQFFRSLAVWGKIYRRSFIDDTRFENHNQGEDRIFLTDLYLKKPNIISINNIVYYWLRHESSSTPTLTHTYGKTLFDEQLNNIIKMRNKFLKSTNMDENELVDLNEHLVRTTYYLYELILNISIEEIDMEKLYVFIKSIDWNNYEDYFFNTFGFSIEKLSNIDSFKENIIQLLRRND